MLNSTRIVFFFLIPLLRTHLIPYFFHQIICNSQEAIYFCPLIQFVLCAPAAIRLAGSSRLLWPCMQAEGYWVGFMFFFHVGLLPAWVPLCILLGCSELPLISVLLQHSGACCSW